MNDEILAYCGLRVLGKPSVAADGTEIVRGVARRTLGVEDGVPSAADQAPCPERTCHGAPFSVDTAFVLEAWRKLIAGEVDNNRGDKQTARASTCPDRPRCV